MSHALSVSERKQVYPELKWEFVYCEDQSEVDKATEEVATLLLLLAKKQKVISL
ncbi:MAG: hypothetical protein WC897_00745 [Candidatus Gracilibacteria bacterium]